MPIDTPHPEYDDMAPDWQRCRDAFRGRRAVRAAGTAYLPWSSRAFSPAEYADYADRAVWYGATERTVIGLAGAISRKDTSIDVPAVIEPHLADVDLAGTAIDGLIGKLLQEQLTTSRCVLQVTMPRDVAAGPDARPYWLLWHAEDVVNWREDRIAGVMTTTRVVLRETDYVPDDDDEYAVAVRTRYRELELVPGAGGLVMRERVWEQESGPQGERWAITEELFPQRRGDYLPFIPVVPVGAQACGWKVEKPALLDLVDMNIADWRNSADYEAALASIKPVYYLFGVPVGTEVVLGSKRAITSDIVGANAGILQGADPVGLRTAIAEKRHAMATLGARLLEAQPDVGETATAVRMRHAGDEASLRTIAVTMGEALTRALRYHAWWMGADEDAVEVSPNMDYVSARLSPDELRAYMELLNNGRISYETFYALLQQGEIARPDVTAEDELAAIEKDTESELGQMRAPGLPPQEGVTPPALAESAEAAREAAEQQE
jgi:hypothetical protein